MEIRPGTTLGSYEITAPIGAGAMGAVYRAKDARLGRSVAIKVISERATLVPNALQRFEQEARAASAIAHPNIVTVHEIGQVDETPYIVMELVEGKSLRKLLADGTLSLKTLLDVAVQIADGLAAAHARGIVHRDLKPENVMVTPAGVVKILDFGLARPFASSGLPTDSTLTSPVRMTEPGVILGTVSYMSPEQARGAEVDFRSDQFSFGAVLYEMATRRVAFKRESGAETLTAIIREDPIPVRDLAPASPVPLRWIIERCLAKEREHRYDSTQDLARELRALREHASEIGSGASAPRTETVTRSRGPGKGWVAAVVILSVVAASAIGLALKWHAPKSLPTFRRLTFQRGHVTGARFAPDGQTVVYSAAWEGKPSEIFSMNVSRPESRSLGVSPAQVVAVTDNGEIALILIDWMASDATFLSGTLAMMPMSGGAPRKIRESVSSADVSRDGKLIAAVVSSLSTMKDRDQLEFPLGTLIASGLLVRPRISPDGRELAIKTAPKRRPAIAVFGRDGSERVLSEGWRSVSAPVWTRNGREIWFSASLEKEPRTLWEVSLSGQRREILQIPALLDIEDVAPDGKALVCRRDFRTEMRLLPAGPGSDRNLSWFEQSSAVSISSDGKTLLFTERGGGGTQPAVYIRSTDGSPPVRLGDGIADSLSPDGRLAVAIPFPPDSTFTLLSTGSLSTRSIHVGPGRFHTAAGWSHNGERLFFWAFSPDGVDTLQELDVSNGKHRPVGGISAAIGGPLSSDGRAVVVHDGEPPYWKVRVLADGLTRPIPGTNENQVVLCWDLDGRSLFINDIRTPYRVSRLYLEDGHVETWKDFAPTDPAGVFGGPGIVLSPGTGTLAYSFSRVLSELYLVEGLK